MRSVKIEVTCAFCGEYLKRSMEMRRYDEKILHLLLDKYESSLLYIGQNQRNQSISIAITKKTLPEYFDEASMQYDLIHAQLLEQEQKGYLQLMWKNKKIGHILEKCVLCPEKAQEIYHLLHRKEKREKEEAILAVCESCKDMHEVINHFLQWITDQISSGGSIKQYVDMDEPEKLESLCYLIEGILTNTEEVFWREFSVRFFCDSKIAEKELTKATAIIERFSEDEELKQLDTEQLLEEFSIYKNPSWVMLKGCGKFYIRHEEHVAFPKEEVAFQEIDLEQFPGGIGISSTDIPRICWEFEKSEKSPQTGLKRVVTIENLTSFHRWQEEGTLAIYLGGYHNHVKREFLRKLYAACPEEVIFEHFGDIDCGGFAIWKNLCEKTRIPFDVRLMDKETFYRYVQYGKPLTEHDKKELRKMMGDLFYEKQWNLFACMLKEDRKVEQECVRR